jgi:LAO/AO transport system kinase
MASRGSLGGLAAATAAVTQVFDAAGFDVILVETVGAGQGEVDIARLAHTTLVVEAPGLGDEIQAIKAGILEIADILVINKADRPGVEATERALKTMLELAHPVRKVFMHHGQVMELNGAETPNARLWIPPIRRTVATEGKWLPELLESIQQHAEHLRQSGDWARRERARLEAEFDLLIQEALVARFRSSIPEKKLDETLDSIQKRKLSPREAVNRLLNGSKP